MKSGSRIVLIDPDASTREMFAQRLRAQGYTVDEAADGVTGAEMALAEPPAAVVSDLWMQGVSGVQLCRLLKAEPATADVPVVLRAQEDDPYNRFWATRAGASRLTSKGRMGELVRALAEATSRRDHEGAFFFQTSTEAHGIRDRIATHLDRALFESVVAAEVRALAGAISFERMFDSLSQLVVQLVGYRWLAISTEAPMQLAVHGHTSRIEDAEREARAVLGVPPDLDGLRVVDEDAADAAAGDGVITHDIFLGSAHVGRIALNVVGASSQAAAATSIVARELGAVIRLATLLEESRRMATTDGLTGLLTRRAFMEQMSREISRAERCRSELSVVLLDLDHFKSINDTRGHGAGDAVLAAVGRALGAGARPYDVVSRWGGEEFVIGLPSTDREGALAFAERLRTTIESLDIRDPATGRKIAVTASLGIAERPDGEALEATIDRADRAMYEAKIGGRNRACGAENPAPAPKLALVANAE